MERESTDNYISSYVNNFANHLKRKIDSFSVAEKTFAPAQAAALHYILGHDQKEVYLKDIEETLRIRQASASQLVKKLENAGFVRRIQSEKDGRFWQLIPTQKAMSYKEQAISDLVSLQSKITEGLSIEEIDEWKRITEKMISNLEQ